jgi:protein-tyrosine sulfotransferase
VSEQPQTKGVVVLGHPRSGTTLLRRWLDAHPAFASPPETHLLSAAARFLHSETTAMGVDMGVRAGLDFAGFSDDETLSRLRKMVTGFLEEYAARNNARRWVEKTAFDVLFTPRIVDLLEDSVCYVGIVRHPLDVAVSTQSFCEKAGVFPDCLHQYIREHSSQLSAFVASWADALSRLMELSERHPEHFILLRYEDMVAAPEEIAEGLFGFLGEEVPKDLTKLGGTTDFGFSDHNTVQSAHFETDRNGRWHDLSAHQIITLAKSVESQMELLGYEMPNVEGPQTVFDARRQYLVGQMAASASDKTTK